jgi:hypothetical protein
MRFHFSQARQISSTAAMLFHARKGAGGESRRRITAAVTGTDF